MVLRGTPEQRARARMLAQKLVVSIAEQTITVPREMWSAIIGVKGARIREMELESGARMVLREEGPEMVPVLAIHGTPEARKSAMKLAQAVIERETYESKPLHLKLAGVIVGKRGFTVKRLEEESDAHIRIERFPETVMVIKGTALQREKAIALAEHLEMALPEILRKLIPGADEEMDIFNEWDDAWSADPETWEKAIGDTIDEALAAWKAVRLKARKLERGLVV